MQLSQRQARPNQQKRRQLTRRRYIVSPKLMGVSVGAKSTRISVTQRVLVRRTQLDSSVNSPVVRNTVPVQRRAEGKIGSRYQPLNRVALAAVTSGVESPASLPTYFLSPFRRALTFADLVVPRGSCGWGSNRCNPTPSPASASHRKRPQPGGAEAVIHRIARGWLRIR